MSLTPYILDLRSTKGDATLADVDDGVSPERLALPKQVKQEPKARKSHARQPPSTAAPPPEASPSVQVLEADKMPQPRRSSAPMAAGEDVDAQGTGARPARARKSVNYAEPKLNTYDCRSQLSLSEKAVNRMTSPTERCASQRTLGPQHTRTLLSLSSIPQAARRNRPLPQTRRPADPSSRWYFQAL